MVRKIVETCKWYQRSCKLASCPTGKCCSDSGLEVNDCFSSTQPNFIGYTEWCISISTWRRAIDRSKPHQNSRDFVAQLGRCTHDWRGKPGGASMHISGLPKSVAPDLDMVQPFHDCMRPSRIIDIYWMVFMCILNPPGNIPYKAKNSSSKKTKFCTSTFLYKVWISCSDIDAKLSVFFNINES